MINKILDANDKAVDEGFADAMDRLRNHHKRSTRAQGEYTMFAWDGETVTTDQPVYAFVERGRWLAICECGSAEWVALGIPFFCRNCGNDQHAGAARLVVFPDDKEAIEAELLRRPVHTRGGRKITEQVLMSIPDNLNLGREWRLGETVADLQDQARIVMEKLQAGE